MEIENSAEYYEDSGLGVLLHEMELGKFFLDKDYGNNDIAIFFVINCIGENTKNRIRLDSKDKVLYWDVILSYINVKNSLIKEKKKLLANAIINSFDILDKYKKLRLDKELIKADAKKYFIEIGWLVD